MRGLMWTGSVAILLMSAPLVTAADERPPPAKITREAATIAALKVIPGKLGDVLIERKRGRWAYVVEIVTAKGDEKDVFVDIENGEVIGTD
jgi:uncharacterized membrane protein YkoI